MSNTLGAPLGGTMRGGHHAFDSVAFSLITPPNFGSGAGSCFPLMVVVAPGEPSVPVTCWASIERTRATTVQIWRVPMRMLLNDFVGVPLLNEFDLVTRSSSQNRVVVNARGIRIVIGRTGRGCSRSRAGYSACGESAAIAATIMVAPVATGVIAVVAAVVIGAAIVVTSTAGVIRAAVVKGASTAGVIRAAVVKPATTAVEPAAVMKPAAAPRQCL